MDRNQRISRRMMLRGAGGIVLGLPLLESWPRGAIAADADAEPFAIFFRQACGVASTQVSEQNGIEPERFWPREEGPLTAESVEGRALDELTDYLPQTLLVSVNKNNYTRYADPHAVGAQQSLTGRGPTSETADRAGRTEADGESLDHRIGRELNPDGRDSLFLYTGPDGGWLGGPCISYRTAGRRRAALRHPWNGYQALVGGTGGLDPAIAEQVVKSQASVNDLVRDQLRDLMDSPNTSRADRQRLELHLTAVRELEVSASCLLQQDALRKLETDSAVFEGLEHEDIFTTTQLHLDVAALAVACGYTRSVCVQVGSGNAGMLRFRHPETNELMDNYHFVSHRIRGDAGSGGTIEGADVLHHYVDRYHARMFRHLLDTLDGQATAGGNTLLSSGVAIWFNDNATGPTHSIKNVPFALCGSAGGFLKQGEYVQLGGYENLCQVLNTIGTAVGLTGDNPDAPLEDFGDPELAGGIRSEMLA